MNPSDDMLKIALAFVEQPEESERVKTAFDNVDRAPLSKLIDDMLEETPAIHLRGSLKTIANLNQGRLSDLDAPDFRSYVIRKTCITDALLNDCISALATYQKVSAAATSSNGMTLMAARTEAGSSRGTTSAVDVLRELRRREA
jgi:hypothetical protein